MSSPFCLLKADLSERYGNLVAHDWPHITGDGHSRHTLKPAGRTHTSRPHPRASGTCQTRALLHSFPWNSKAPTKVPRPSGPRSVASCAEWNYAATLKAISMPKPKGAVLDGMKVTALTGPNTTQSAPSCPVLAIGSFTL